MGVVTDYNGVDINQTSIYIEQSCESYIRRLLKSHNWDEDIRSVGDVVGIPNDHELEDLGLPSSSVIAAINKLEVQSRYSPVSPFQ